MLHGEVQLSLSIGLEGACAAWPPPPPLTPLETFPALPQTGDAARGARPAGLGLPLAEQPLLPHHAGRAGGAGAARPLAILGRCMLCRLPPLRAACGGRPRCSPACPAVSLRMVPSRNGGPFHSSTLSDPIATPCPAAVAARRRHQPCGAAPGAGVEPGERQGPNQQQLSPWVCLSGAAAAAALPPARACSAVSPANDSPFNSPLSFSLQDFQFLVEDPSAQVRPASWCCWFQLLLGAVLAGPSGPLWAPVLLVSGLLTHVPASPLLCPDLPPSPCPPPPPLPPARPWTSGSATAP